MLKTNKLKRPDKEIYSDDYFFLKPKEYYKEVVNFLSKKKYIKNCLDIGSANGSFIFYARKKLNLEFSGVEPVRKLISISKKKNPNVKIHNNKLFDKKLDKFKNQFSVVTALGVINLFDDIDKTLKRLKFFLKKKGICIIVSTLNHYPIDVISRYKRSSSNQWEFGQNMFSIKTIKKISKKLKFKTKIFKARQISIKSKKDIMRSWTLNLKIRGKKEKYLFDGMGRIKTTYIVILEN